MAPGQNIDIADLPPELKEDAGSASWQEALASEVTDTLNRGEQNVMETRTNIFERILIEKALWT